MVRRLPPVADKVHSSDDLTNGEETNNLGGSDTDQSDLLGAGVANAGQDVGGRAARWAAGGGEKVLVVGLEGGHVAIIDVSGRFFFRCLHSRQESLRRRHVLATEHQLAELKSDSRVVDGRGYHS